MKSEMLCCFLSGLRISQASSHNTKIKSILSQIQTNKYLLLEQPKLTHLCKKETVQNRENENAYLFNRCGDTNLSIMTRILYAQQVLR